MGDLRRERLIRDIDVEAKITRMKEEKKVKDSRLFEVVEEVFDFRTLMALYELLNKGVIGRMYGVVATGKEARVYWAQTPEGEDIAVKIFLVQTTEFRRNRLIYIMGDPRFKKIKKGFRNIIDLWCTKEFVNLKRAYKSGVRVPRPYAKNYNVLVMEFIGDPEERGRPAPLLKEADLKNPEEAFNTLRGFIEKLYLDAKLVHGDLSEYNVMVRGNELVLIDFGSAVDIRHPLAADFLSRDINNVYKFFQKLGVETGSPEELYLRLTSTA